MEAVFQLPCGYVDAEGGIHKEIAVAKMKGRVRKIIARQDIRSDPIKVLDALLINCVTRIGKLEKPTKTALDSLVIGDRDFAALMIRKVSRGDEISVDVNCPTDTCKRALHFVLSIDDIAVFHRDEEDSWFDEEARAFCFKITDRDLGVDATFRFPTGFDQHAVSKVIKANPVEAMYRLYGACCREWNGDKGPFDLGFIENQDTDVLDFLEDQWTTRLPGVEVTHEAECEECLREFRVTLESSDFIFQTPKKRGKKDGGK